MKNYKPTMKTSEFAQCQECDYKNTISEFVITRDGDKEILHCPDCDSTDINPCQCFSWAGKSKASAQQAVYSDDTTRELCFY